MACRALAQIGLEDGYLGQSVLVLGRAASNLDEELERAWHKGR